MGIKDKYRVLPIERSDYKEWLLYKHYAHRIPSISYAFGLYENNILNGVCTFGMPPNYIEMKAWRPFDLLELNRLVVNDGLPKNTLSYFVSKSIKFLPSPVVLISYSDLRMGHHGYIYQATNWIYTGVGGEGQKIYVMKDKTERHQRHGDKINMNLVDHIELTEGKARYFYFHADKNEKKKLYDMLRFKILPYPKGDNERYDTGYQPDLQPILF
jgi:hypothetical protein